VRLKLRPENLIVALVGFTVAAFGLISLAEMWDRNQAREAEWQRMQHFEEMRRR